MSLASGPRRTIALFKKELRGYFASPVGYVFIVFYLLLSNGLFFFVRDFFGAGQASMREYFAMVPWVLLFFVPALTMRSWAEEKRSGTRELLLTLPLSEGEAVLGKFLAGFSFLSIAMVFSWTVPFSVGYLGRPDWGVIIASYLGSLLLGASYLAVGLLISSVTENQVSAFVGTIVTLFVLLAAGLVPLWIGNLGGAGNLAELVAVCEYISLYSHFQSILRGVMDSRDVVYYLSVVVFFLWLNARHIESRKWR